MLPGLTGQAGQHQSGLDTVDEMLGRCEATEERWYEPELMRIRGELLVLGGASAESVESQFQQAIALAGRQGARSWQLRAVTSLAKFGRDAGDGASARIELSQLYQLFEEGFATSDLQQASQVLSAV